MIRIKNLKNKTEQEIIATVPENHDNKCYVFLFPEEFAQEHGLPHIFYYRDERAPM